VIRLYSAVASAGRRRRRHQACHAEDLRHDRRSPLGRAAGTARCAVGRRASSS